MRRTTEGELVGSEADRRVRVVRYTPPLYTIHTSCRSSIRDMYTDTVYRRQCVLHYEYFRSPEEPTSSPSVRRMYGHRPNHSQVTQ